MIIPEVMSHEALLSVLDDIRARVAEGDSFEGHIEWLIPEDPGAGHHRAAVRGAYRIGNTMGQGGMRVIGTIAPE